MPLAVQVMTSVYGVTATGARDQVRNRLKERGAQHDLEDDVAFALAVYGAKVRMP